MTHAEIDKAFVGLGLVLILCFLGLLWATKEEAKACAAKGGHVVSKTTVGFGPAIGGNGGVAVVPTTVSFCISADGRILE